MNPLRTAVDTDLLFVLALVGFYLLRHLMARRAPAQQKPQPGRQSQAQVEPAYDDALNEIRRELGMGPVRVPEPQPVLRPLPQPSDPGRAPRGEFHAPRSTRVDAEERFERGASTFRDPLAGHTHARKAEILPTEQPAPKRARLLASRRQLRDAFVLKEIVGPPRARKKEIR